MPRARILQFFFFTSILKYLFPTYEFIFQKGISLSVFIGQSCQEFFLSICFTVCLFLYANFTIEQIHHNRFNMLTTQSNRFITTDWKMLISQSNKLINRLRKCYLHSLNRFITTNWKMLTSLFYRIITTDWKMLTSQSNSFITINWKMLTSQSNRLNSRLRRC